MSRCEPSDVDDEIVDYVVAGNSMARSQAAGTGMDHLPSKQIEDTLMKDLKTNAVVAGRSKHYGYLCYQIRDIRDSVFLFSLQHRKTFRSRS